MEERIIDHNICKWLCNLGKYSVKGEYGMITSMFRVPTLMRKIFNEHTFIQREDIGVMESFSEPKGFGASLGGLVGAIFDFGFITYSLHESMVNGNYTPLTILGVTNLASGIYELGRFSSIRQEKSQKK